MISMLFQHFFFLKSTEANYATCSKKASDCRYDHEHCHLCLQAGHWASTCSADLTVKVDGTDETYSLCSEVAEALYSALRAGGREDEKKGIFRPISGEG